MQPAKAAPKYGVPPTDMPVSAARSDLGATLSFDGSPTDVVKIEVYYLRCVLVGWGAWRSSGVFGKVVCACVWSSVPGPLRVYV